MGYGITGWGISWGGNDLVSGYSLRSITVSSRITAGQIVALPRLAIGKMTAALMLTIEAVTARTLLGCSAMSAAAKITALSITNATEA